MLNPFVVGDRLYLRPLEPADAPLLAASNNDPEVRHTFFTHTPVSIAHEERRIREELYRPGATYLPLAICLKENAKAIGLVSYNRLDLVSGMAVFGICLTDRAEWGKGYAREATELTLLHGFEALNLHRIQLHVWVGNTAAIRIYETCGFQREGVLREAMRHDGQWCDFLVMGLLEDEWRALRKDKGAAGSRKSSPG
jgi:RimJ/RimL family protein N-acetyltransferase